MRAASLLAPSSLVRKQRRVPALAGWLAGERRGRYACCLPSLLPRCFSVAPHRSPGETAPSPCARWPAAPAAGWLAPGRCRGAAVLLAPSARCACWRAAGRYACCLPSRSLGASSSRLIARRGRSTEALRSLAGPAGGLLALRAAEGAALPPRSLGASSSRLIARRGSRAAALRSLAGFVGTSRRQRSSVQAPPRPSSSPARRRLRPLRWLCSARECGWAYPVAPGSASPVPAGRRVRGSARSRAA